MKRSGFLRSLGHFLLTFKASLSEANFCPHPKTFMLVATSVLLAG